MTPLKFTLPGIPKAKKNSKRIFYRNGKVVVIPSALHEEWHTEALWLLKKYKQHQFRECGIKVIFYPPNKRRFDMSNSFESLADALVDAGILVDDSSSMLQRVELLYGGVDKEPRVEVTIHSYA